MPARRRTSGPSGVTVVIVREDLLARSQDALPTMLNLKTQAENGSMYNTPPTFGIYILRLVMKWLMGLGGLAAIDAINARKAAAVYAELDRTGFWRPHADKDSRSRMNITFRLPSEDLETTFAGKRRPRASTASKGIARSAAFARRSTTRFRKPGSRPSSSSCGSSSARTGRWQLGPRRGRGGR